MAGHQPARSQKASSGRPLPPWLCAAPGHDTSLLEHLDACLDHARSNGSNIILAGDFNVHNESWIGSSKTTRAGEYLEELCAAHGLHQHVEMATRGNNPLDLVLSNFGDRVRVEAMSPIGNSDHCVLLASISTHLQREERTQRQVWRYNQADWGRLRKFFRDANCDTIIHDDPDEACCTVTEKILEGMRQFIPQKRLLTRTLRSILVDSRVHKCCPCKTEIMKQISEAPIKTERRHVQSFFRSECYLPSQRQKT